MRMRAAGDACNARVVDLQAMYEDQRPFTLAELAAQVQALNRCLYTLVPWAAERSLRRAPSASDDDDDAELWDLIRSLTTWLRLLRTRDEARPFCAPEAWTLAPTGRAASAFVQNLLSGAPGPAALLHWLPWTVPWPTRLQVFRETVRIHVGGRRDRGDAHHASGTAQDDDSADEDDHDGGGSWRSTWGWGASAARPADGAPSRTGSGGLGAALRALGSLFRRNDASGASAEATLGPAAASGVPAPLPFPLLPDAPTPVATASSPPFTPEVAAGAARLRAGVTPPQAGPASARAATANPSQPVLLTIRRSALLLDASRQVNSLSPAQWRGRVRVRFVNAEGLAEAGIDQRGVLKEFLEDTCKALLRREQHLFEATPLRTLMPVPTSHLAAWAAQAPARELEPLPLYTLLGRILGKAVREDLVLDVPLAPPFLAALRGDRCTLSDLVTVDPELHRTLVFLKNYDGDVDALALTFAVDEDVPLPGGVRLPEAGGQPATEADGLC